MSRMSVRNMWASWEDSWKHPLGNRVLLDAGAGVGALLSAFLDRLFTAGACKTGPGHDLVRAH